MLIALVVALSVAGCEGDSKKVDKPTPSVSRVTAKAITPLGDGELIVFERLVSEDEDPSSTRWRLTAASHGCS